MRKIELSVCLGSERLQTSAPSSSRVRLALPCNCIAGGGGGVAGSRGGRGGVGCVCVSEGCIRESGRVVNANSNNTLLDKTAAASREPSHQRGSFSPNLI